MFKFIEKWALKRILKRVAEKLPEAEGKIAQLWAAHSNEIFEKVLAAIEKTVSDIIKKAIEKTDKKK